MFLLSSQLEESRSERLKRTGGQKQIQTSLHLPGIPDRFFQHGLKQPSEKCLIPEIQQT